MTTRISGVLIDGFGKPIANAQMQAVALETGGSIVGSSAHTRTGGDGSYDFTLEIGSYSFSIWMGSLGYQYVGNIHVYENTPDCALDDILSLPSSVQPVVLTKVLQAVVDAQEAADSAAKEVRDNLVPLGKQYMTLSEAQADIANIPEGSTIYYRSPDDGALAIEMINTGGVLMATGRMMPSVLSFKTGYISSNAVPDAEIVGGIVVNSDGTITNSSSWDAYYIKVRKDDSVTYSGTVGSNVVGEQMAYIIQMTDKKQFVGVLASFASTGSTVSTAVLSGVATVDGYVYVRVRKTAAFTLVQRKKTLVLEDELDTYKAEIGEVDTLVRTTEMYRDVENYSWGIALKSGESLPGTLQGSDGLPADENIAAYAKKGVSVFSDAGDNPIGHAITKDGLVLASWDQRGHVSYLPPFNMQARASVLTSPVMTPTQLPESVRTAIEPCALLACKYTLNQQFPLIVPLAGGSGIPSSITTMTVLEANYVYLAAAAAWIGWVDAGYTTWDGDNIGVSYADAVAWTAQGVELIVAAHIANGGTWGGPMPPWSDDTGSVALTFASQAAEAARNISNYADLIWPHLTDDVKEKVKAMVVHEATRFVTYAPKYLFSLPNRYGAVVTNYPGDSKSEELAWNLSILPRALVLDPNNENAERWAERMVTMQIAALGDRNDLSDPMPLNGLAPRDTLRGTNVNPTRLVENHNVVDGQDISRWYSMAALSGSEWIIKTFLRANLPVPAVALWHMRDTMRAVAYMPDGSLWNMDWREPVGELSYAPLIAYMFADPNEDYITQFLHRVSIFAGQQDPTTGALPAGSFNWPVYGSSQPGEILQMIMLSERMNDPLTAPHSTNAHYTHLAAIYRSV